MQYLAGTVGEKILRRPFTENQGLLRVAAHLGIHNFLAVQTPDPTAQGQSTVIPLRVSCDGKLAAALQGGIHGAFGEHAHMVGA